MRKTKIVCTVGPACNNKEMLLRMIDAGMNVARINMSHGDYSVLEGTFAEIHAAIKESGKNIAILLDTKGPEVRVTTFEGGGAEVADGAEFTLYKQKEQGDSEGVALSYPKLVDIFYSEGSSAIGREMLFDDGMISMNVKAVYPDRIVCKVCRGGFLKNRKSINIPGYHISMPYVSAQDRRDIEFGLEHGANVVAASFVRTHEDVRTLRDFIDSLGYEHVEIIAKIENQSGVDDMELITDYADGIMVARGDMGVELPPEQVPYIQKKMIDMANAAGKITICATQMLESMTHNPRPTRAEVGDVANAVYDGATAVMLSGESAAGDYPLESVEMMSKIAEESEKHLHNVYHAVDDSQRSIVGKAACDLADTLGVEKIIVYTDTGRSPAVVSQIKPKTPIIVMTRNEKVYYQSALLYGVEPVRIADIIEDENLEAKTREYMEKVNLKSAILLFGHAIDSIKVLNR